MGDRSTTIPAVQMRRLSERAGAGASVGSLSLADVREGGPARVAERLLALRGEARYVVANVVDASDLDVLALGLTLAERAGMRVVCRTGPSFLAARAGHATAPPLDARELALHRVGRGLLVVGSHTELTNAQLREADRRHPLPVVTLDVEALLAAEGAERDALVARVADALRTTLKQGDAALVTSRRSAHVRHGASSLASVRPGIRFVVFPGNVGDEQMLAGVLERVNGSG
jgi:uncharacterized protein YgbK (DUF1537 family)